MIAVLSLLGLLLISEADSEADKQAEELPSLSPMEVVKTRLFYQVRSEYLIEVESHTYIIIRYISGSSLSVAVR